MYYMYTEGVPGRSREGETVSKTETREGCPMGLTPLASSQSNKHPNSLKTDAKTPQICISYHATRGIMIITSK